MSDACDQCGHECQEIARLAVQNNRNLDLPPLHCMMVALAGIVNLFRSQGWNEEANYLLNDWINKLTLLRDNKLDTTDIEVTHNVVGNA